LRFMCPLLVVEDMERSRKFYTEIMEQMVRYDYGENVTFHGDFAIHRSDHYQKLLGDHEIHYRSNNFELYFEHDDVDTFFQRIAQQVEIIHPPLEQPWRQKVMRLYDPDGHVLEVGESLEHTARRLLREGLTESQVAGILTMPLEFVQAANPGK
jgi:uncharacterized glyoxalase superfamily protein PhnB